jgi:hypothetical protein
MCNATKLARHPNGVIQCLPYIVASKTSMAVVCHEEGSKLHRHTSNDRICTLTTAKKQVDLLTCGNNSGAASGQPYCVVYQERLRLCHFILTVVCSR